MRPSATLIALTAFAAAAGLALLLAVFAASAIEARAVRLADRALASDGIDWAEVSADGLTVTLKGTAPSEALRFRALSLAGSAVGAGRVIDAMAVTPPETLAPPAFGIEFLRNDDGVSVIGLVPADWDQEALRRAASRAAGGLPVTDMLQTSAAALPPGWQAAVDFAIGAIGLVPRAKVSAAPGRVTVTAIADSAAQKVQFETALARAVPRTNPPLVLHLDIAAPRPVIAPFTLRFVIDGEGARFDACSAASERGRTRIIAAGIAAGAQGRIDCTLGLGAPSPRWADAAVAGLAALAEVGAGSLTMSDTDISLLVPHTVDPAAFDRATGALAAALPEVFSLRADRLDPPETARTVAAAQFTATRALDGGVELRGRIGDERLRGVTEAFARARFGAGAVNAALRVDPEGLPEGWTARVLASIAALAAIEEGAVLVEAGRVAVRGRSGDPQARAEVARILAAQLGQGAEWTADVAYDAALDPNPPPLPPGQCVDEANAILAQSKIVFPPGAAEVPAAARPALAAIAAILRRCEGVAIEIAGHTDSQGRAESNLALSEARAEAVRAALGVLGVPLEAITARGYGASDSIADNATEEGREANRRIAFSLAAPPADGAAPGRTGGRADLGPAPAAPGDAAPDGTSGAAADAAPAPAEAAPIIAGVLAAAPPGAAPDAAPSFAPAAMTMRPARRPAAWAATPAGADGGGPAAEAAPASAPHAASAPPTSDPAPAAAEEE